jgi:hypothetical protein
VKAVRFEEADEDGQESEPDACKMKRRLWDVHLERLRKS